MSRRILVLLAAWTGVLGGCVEAPRPLGEQCDRTTDCDTPLVCRLGRCRRECGNVRDCPVDAVCVPTNEGSGACLLPEETRCALASDCPDPLVCRGGRCGNECVEDRDCASGAVCAEVEGGSVCVDPAESACRLSSDCGREQACIDGRCLSPCRADRDCREGARCEGGACVAIERPDAGPRDAGVDARVVVETCEMPADCWAPNVASFGCDASACVIDACADGFGDCNETYADGCETDLRDDVAHCGACGRTCGLGGSCESGSCDGLADLSLSGSQTCAVRGNGRILCGGEIDAALGSGERRDELTPDVVLVATVDDAVEVEAGFGVTCARHATEAVSCWGEGGSFGALGDGSWSTRFTPRAVIDGAGSPLRATALDLTQYHACAVRPDGQAVCWGWGTDGQIGDGMLASRNVATEVAGITDAIDVSTGSNFSCAIHGAGEVSCWGDNLNGYLGDGVMDHGPTCDDFAADDCSPTPVAVVGIDDAVQIDSGGDHTCVVHAGGGVSCWGSAGLDLGQGPLTDPLYVPAAVAGIDDAVQVACHRRDTCVRRASGAVTCFGSNADGMLAVGNDADVETPTDMMTVTDATDVSLGDDEACVLSAAGGMLCAGSNDTEEMNLGPTRVGEEWTTLLEVGGFQ
ncbi:MAG TPA: Dickkopf N-terminal cysteine-rich domain-containing protein [Sandaracinaceae bacterium LLY-WYZ-13_1]|nr:Dickkopf N-terminal cysteine-rich domain-containing protein [Sandaracinaceae bacterium LLY-WYZ-13_1]